MLFTLLCPMILIAMDSLQMEDGDFDVLHYDLSLEVMEDVHLISGSVEITFVVVGNDLDSLLLNLVSLQMDSAKHGDESLNFRQDKRTVTLILPQHLNPGDTASVLLSFSGTPGRSRELEAGFYWDLCFREHPVYMFYGMEPASCRYMFPCRDVIDDKATFFTEITVSDTLIALAPGRLMEVETLGERKTFRWNMPLEMPLYTWGLVISDFTVSEDEEYAWIKYYGFEEYSELIDYIFENVNLMIDCFEKLYGSYPWNHDLNFPITPGGLYGEHNTMPYTFIPREDYVSHELSHMWWGNLVTESDWSEIWLAEGMATYSEALWKEWMYGDKYYEIHMNTVMEDYLDSGEHSPIVPAEGYLWTSTSYDKGASVIHMLRHVLGDEQFFEGLRTFLSDNAYGSVDTEDFMAAFESISGMDLDWFFGQWVFGRGIPDYRISWSSRQGERVWEVQLCIRQVQTVDSIFAMPVDIVVYGEGNDSLFVLWNDEELDTFNLITEFQPVSVVLDPNRWILRAGLLNISTKKPPDIQD